MSKMKIHRVGLMADQTLKNKKLMILKMQPQKLQTEIQGEERMNEKEEIKRH